MQRKTRFFLTMFVLLGTLSYAQTKTEDEKLLKIAALQLKKGSKEYNPTVGFETFKKKAAQGNGMAMNGMGMIYCKGITVPVNEKEAIKWYNKAGENGYPLGYYNTALLYQEGVGVAKDHVKAIYYFEKAAKGGYNPAYMNWAEMVKNGLGTKKDYKLAMEIFKKGTDLGEAYCLYGQGYLHYKGFGTPQDYNKAVALFEAAASKNIAPAAYMLGYCYRNGYGVSIDTQKAKQWLEKAARQGLNIAQLELLKPEADNVKPNQLKTVSTPIPEDLEKINTVEVPKKLIKVKQRISKQDISGQYTGQLIRYDWSGQNILTTTPIEVTLNQEGKAITGTWIEKEGDSISFNAKIEEKAIVFDNTKIDRFVRSLEPTLVTFKFKKAKLQILESKEDVYLAGNLQLYNIKEHEDEKPMFLLLQRKATQNDATAAVSNLTIFPNPVTTQDFKLSFELKEQTPISVAVYDFSGLLISKENITTTGIGLQEQNIPFTAQPGNYILNLYYGDQVIRTILIKK
jgi:uncharacterized protein